MWPKANSKTEINSVKINSNLVKPSFLVKNNKDFEIEYGKNSL